MGAGALAQDGTVLFNSSQQPSRFAWASSDSAVAGFDEDTVLTNGATAQRVRGMNPGTATITATSHGLTGTMTVTVADRARPLWSTFLGAGAVGSPVAVGADGTIYVGTDHHATGRSTWHALSSSGSLLWTVDLPLTWRSHPAIGEDGTLYFTGGSAVSSENTLTALDRGGAELWTVAGFEIINSAPVISPDGSIIVAAGHHVHAVAPDGTVRWTYRAAGRVFKYSAPAVSSDGTIYVGGYDNRLHAINPDGSGRWTFQTRDLIQSSPAVGSDGAVYFGSMDGSLYAVNPDGSERWSVPVDFRGVPSSPSIGPDGTIYVGGAGVFAITPGGSVRWHFPGSQVTTTPIIGANGNVYVAAAGGITALDSEGQLLWNHPVGGSTHGSPAIGPDGTIIVASFTLADGGTVQAMIEINATNGGYAGSPWPTSRRDPTNAARAGS